ncbi:MAG TPA: CUB domain-containing protein, partial [Bacteroidia bacterium]
AEAYQLHPSIPRGILEAVAFTNSRFHHITHNVGEEESCMGLPKAYGVMGLVADGKNYFQNNLAVVAKLSGTSADEIITTPEKNILAYAAAYEAAQKYLLADSKIENQVPILVFLSELPANGSLQNNFAMCTHLYSVLSFMNTSSCSAKYVFPDYQIDLTHVFGEENLKVLSSSFITVSSEKISDKNGNNFRGTMLPSLQTTDYPPALWVASPNYNSRSGTAISAVTIHDTEGSYAASISWFQNTSSQVSAHYVMRSSDGQCTQTVLEANRAWHVGTENNYTIGIEHEGYAAQTGWYTTAMYQASANLVKDICNSGYGILPIHTGFWPWLATTYYNQSSIPGACTKIKGHQHYPNQTHTDPGPNWDWDYYFKLVNPMPTPTTYTTSTGTCYDSGGASGNYSDNERLVWVIAPAGASSVSLTFSSFNTENTWDYLYVYDGTDVWAPLLGKFTGTTNPGTLVASSGKMCLEFRSDCATNAAGWNASWTSNASSVTPTNLSTTGLGCPQIGVTLNWQNSGSNWSVDVTDDPTFTNYYTKAVPSVTSVGCPGGFANNTVSTKYLAFQPNTTYYWRVSDGTTKTSGQPFATPTCMYNDTTCAGTFDDTGGSSAAYKGNEDWKEIIQPVSASSVTMNFTSFDLELNADSLWIYDGQPTASPVLIGIYTGTVSPGSVTANSGVMTLHFKSDPFVNNAGWTATWSCVSTTGITEQINSDVFSVYPNPFSETAEVKWQSAQGKEPSRFMIYNLYGQTVKEIFIPRGAQNLTIERNDLPDGMYFFEVLCGKEKIKDGKIVIK